MFNLTVFSQTVTDTNSICLKNYTARLIVLDLISGDSAKEELKVTKTLLTLTEKQSTYKDSVIHSYVLKDSLYDNEINLYKKQQQIFADYNKQLKKDIKKTKLKIQIISLSTIIITFTSAFILYVYH